MKVKDFIKTLSIFDPDAYVVEDQDGDDLVDVRFESQGVEYDTPDGETLTRYVPTVVLSFRPEEQEVRRG